jgi:hypothetical protein
MIVWVALGGRGRLWGAMLGALLVNYAYSITTSDMPRAWPFLEGGMFIAVVLLFPSGLVGLWDRFERDIAAGMRVSGILIAMATGFLALLVDNSSLGSHVPYNLTLWIAGLIMVLSVLRGAGPSGVLPASLTMFFVMEALGLVPEALQAAWLGVPIKYYILLLTLGGAVLMSRLGESRQVVGSYCEPVTEH